MNSQTVARRGWRHGARRSLRAGVCVRAGHSPRGSELLELQGLEPLKLCVGAFEARDRELHGSEVGLCSRELGRDGSLRRPDLQNLCYGRGRGRGRREFCRRLVRGRG